MTSFILIAVLITIAAVALLVWPLFKISTTSSYQRQAQNIHFAKQRLHELEQQRDNAGISDADYQALKLEIESTLAQDIDLAQNTPAPALPESANSNGILIALLCGLIPFAALVLYQITGTPQALETQSIAAAGPTGEPSQQDIDSMVRSLQQRLQSNPDDLEGWAMLARTYLALGRYPEAITTNKKLLELGGENPDIYATLADASALQAGGNLAGQPQEYVRRALALNPQHPQGLWLAGLSEAQQGNNLSAREYWDQLMPLLADEPEQQEELRKIIKQTLNQEALPQTGLQDETQTVTANLAGLTVKVELDKSMAGLTSPSDTVFVFAKAQNGPPAPLAVKRLRVSDLPVEVRLSDADSMMPQFRLSLFEDVVLSARVAKSGNPVAQPGDIQSAAIASKNNSDAVIDLKISEIVK